MLVVVKQPAERLVLLLLEGRGVDAIISSAGQARGLVVGSAAIDTTAAALGGGVELTVAGGTDGERYLVTIRAELADGQDVEAEAEIAVIDAAWAMPDGGTPYLSIAEFVALFGLSETVTMTDADGSGRIDRTYLISALRAAQGEADVYLAARYVTPLGTIPEVVKTAIADRACARLYPRGAPEGVTTRARSAEQLLVRISKGELPLPLPTGGVAAAQETSTPIVISDRGRRVYPHGLGGL